MRGREPSKPRSDSGARAAAVGVLLGAAATIKPTFLLVAPIVLAYLLAERRTSEHGDGSRTLAVVAVHAAALVCGAFLPVAAALSWVVWLGGWHSMVDLYRNYVPLYLHLDGDHHALTGTQRVWNAVRGTITLGGLWPWVLPAALGFYAALARRAVKPAARRTCWLLLGLLAVLALEPATSGQFFDYHWMPFEILLLCAAALAFIEPFTLATGERAPRWLGAVVIAGVSLIALHPAPEAVSQLLHGRVPPPEGGRSEQIADYLKAHLRPGDTVQSLGLFGGGIHGMLLARAPIATDFPHEFQFFHDVDTPVVRHLRNEFVAELNAAQPRFIIDEYGSRPIASGPGTATTFPELDQLVEHHYVPVYEGAGFNIDERVARW